MAQMLPTELADFVNGEIASGRFRSLEEMEVHGLWLLKRDRENAIRGIQEGVESMRRGEGKPLDEVVDNIRREYSIPDAE